MAPSLSEQAASATITKSLLQFTDNVSAPSSVTYTILTKPADGTLLLNGSATSTFTQAEINSGLITYRENGSAASSDLFTFDVSDAAGNLTSNQSFRIAISGSSGTPTNLGGIFSSTQQVTTATTIGAPVQLLDGAALEIENPATVTVVGGGSVDNSDNNLSAALDIFGGATLAIDIATTIDIGILNNSGTLVVSPGAGDTVQITTGFHNNGDPGERFINDGTVQVELGTLQILQGGSSNASGFAVATGATLLFTGDAFTVTGGAYNVAGTTEVGDASNTGSLTFAAGTTVNLANSWAINGTVDMSAATLIGSFDGLTMGTTGNTGELLLGAGNAAISDLNMHGSILVDSGQVNSDRNSVCRRQFRG